MNKQIVELQKSLKENVEQTSAEKRTSNELNKEIKNLREDFVRTNSIK